MTLSRFLRIDSFVLDAAGLVALLAGATTFGIALLAIAAVTFVASVALGRRMHLTG